MQKIFGIKKYNPVGFLYIFTQNEENWDENKYFSNLYILVWYNPVNAKSGY